LLTFESDQVAGVAFVMKTMEKTMTDLLNARKEEEDPRRLKLWTLPLLQILLPLPKTLPPMGTIQTPLLSVKMDNQTQ
jgi:hypothetical protein